MKIGQATLVELLSCLEVLLHKHMVPLTGIARFLIQHNVRGAASPMGSARERFLLEEHFDALIVGLRFPLVSGQSVDLRAQLREVF